MDCSLPGSSIHGIFQARVLEWGAIAFSTLILTEMQIKTSMRRHLTPVSVAIIKKAKWLSEEALQIAEKRREVKGRGEKEKIYPSECRVPKKSRER